MIIFLEKIFVYSLNILMLCILVDAVIKFFPHNKQNYLIKILNQIAELILSNIRKITPSFGLGLDLSPLLAIVLLKILEKIIILSFRILAGY